MLLNILSNTTSVLPNNFQHHNINTPQQRPKKLQHQFSQTTPNATTASLLNNSQHHNINTPQQPQTQQHQYSQNNCQHNNNISTTLTLTKALIAKKRNLHQILQRDRNSELLSTKSILWYRVFIKYYVFS